MIADDDHRDDEQQHRRGRSNDDVGPTELTTFELAHRAARGTGLPLRVQLETASGATRRAHGCRTYPITAPTPAEDTSVSIRVSP